MIEFLIRKIPQLFRSNNPTFELFHSDMDNNVS